MNIRVDLNTSIKDGTEVVFRSPVDCSQVTGLKVYYVGADGNTTSQEFAFADAHGNNVGDIDHLFAENVAVKVILDVTTGMAFVQNADTNAYLEGRFDGIIDQLCPNFTESGSAVVCEPVEAYPLNVVSHIVPVQEGSGDPSPDNVRPITGHSAVQLWRGGKNLLDVSTAGLYHPNASNATAPSYLTRTETGLRIEEAADSSGGYGRCGIYLGTVKELAGKTITVDCKYSTSMTTSGASKNIYISSVSPAPANVFEKPMYKDGGYITTSNFSDLASGWGKSVTYTVTGEENREYIAILFYPNAGGAYVAGDWAEFNNLQVEIGDTPTAYEPYRGETVTLDFGQTVYGGSLDWNTGILTVTHTSVVLDGVTTGKRMTTADGSAKTYVYVKALNGLPIKPGGVTHADRAHCWVSQTSSIFFLGLSADITDVTDEDNGSTVVSKFNAVLKAWYDAGTPLTAVFEMAEPYTVQLTPQEILALSGINTLYSDTGDTEVTGKADPTAVIEKLTNAIIALGGNV